MASPDLPPVAGMETTAEMRRRWISLAEADDATRSDRQWLIEVVAPLCRDITRAAALLRTERDKLAPHTWVMLDRLADQIEGLP